MVSMAQQLHGSVRNRVFKLTHFPETRASNNPGKYNVASSTTSPSTSSSAPPRGMERDDTDRLVRALLLCCTSENELPRFAIPNNDEACASVSMAARAKVRAVRANLIDWRF